MFPSVRLGSLLGFPIRANLSFFLLLLVVLAWMGGFAGLGVVLVAAGSVLLHELGHALMARRLGLHIAGIELHFFGGAAQMTGHPRSARDEILIAAAGPAVSLVLAGLGFGLGAVFASPLVALIGWINLVLAIFNLIPALPMDGGRILRALLTRRMDYVRATDTSVTVARAFAVGFVVLGMLASNLQLVILAPLLWMMSSRERLMARMMAPRIGYDRNGYHDRGFEVMRPRPRSWGFHDDDDDRGRNPRRVTIRSVGGRWIIDR